MNYQVVAMLGLVASSSVVIVLLNGALDVGHTTSKNQYLKKLYSSQTTTALPAEARKCQTIEPRETIAEDKRPGPIVLNPKRLLYPALKWGPNNQLLGLYQSIFLAIRLNRSLGLPMFRTHYSIGTTTIATDKAIDVEKLRSFMSVVTMEEMREMCGGSFDVAFRGSNTHDGNERYEKETSMSIANISSWYPGSEYKIGTDPEQPWLASSDVERAHNTTLPCAVHLGPFMSIDVKPRGGLALPLPYDIDKNIPVSEVPDDVLYSAIIDAVRRPACLADAAKSYIDFAFNGQDYIAVHWRYSSEWNDNECSACPSDEEKHRNRCMRCEARSKMRSSDVANGIQATLATASIPLHYVYVAVMPYETKFAIDVLQHLGVDQAHIDLKTFLSLRRSDCWNSGDWNDGDVISLVEQELGIRSAAFFHSINSTWSMNVLPLRVDMSSGEAKPNFSVYHTTLDAMQKRLRRDVNSNVTDTSVRLT